MIYLGESYFYYFQIEMTETYWLIDQKRNSKTYLYDDNHMHREDLIFFYLRRHMLLVIYRLDQQEKRVFGIFPASFLSTQP
jgi:hypothetical protein